MTANQRLPISLTPLDVALAALLNGVEPVIPVELPLVDALRCIAADMPRLGALPPHDIAAVDGYAFCARDLVGASSYSPLPLAALPAWVEAGEAIAEGCDCVLEFRFHRPVRSDAAGTGGSDPGAGGAPRRWRYCRWQPRRRGRAACSRARSPDRARCWNKEAESAPAAAAPRQYPGRHGHIGFDRGERADRRRRCDCRHRCRARCRIDCCGNRRQRVRSAVDGRR